MNFFSTVYSLHNTFAPNIRQCKTKLIDEICLIVRKSKRQNMLHFLLANSCRIQIYNSKSCCYRQIFYKQSKNNEILHPKNLCKTLLFLMFSNFFFFLNIFFFKHRVIKTFKKLPC